MGFSEDCLKTQLKLRLRNFRRVHRPLSLRHNPDRGRVHRDAGASTLPETSSSLRLSQPPTILDAHLRDRSSDEGKRHEARTGD